jgi:uncharacterized Tic20 family protein
MNQETQALPGKDERTWGMLCHLTAFAGFIVPFGNLIAPLVIWLVKKDELPFVNDQGKESLNFQITIFIAFVISFVLLFVGIGLLLIGIIAVYDIVMIIVASIKANEGVAYRYPYTLRLIH